MTIASFNGSASGGLHRYCEVWPNQWAVATRLLAILDRMDGNPDDEAMGDEQDQSVPEGHWGWHSGRQPFEDAEDDDPAEANGDDEPYLAGSCDDREDGDDNGIADSGGMLSWYGH